ncbi:pre-mRNA processing RNA-helicase [Tulasnella sp. JGI-2019a]|nr:pre-mRNA processing RNA-helicase [Tulasnella sp. JGI-2019a]
MSPTKDPRGSYGKDDGRSSRDKNDHWRDRSDRGGGGNSRYSDSRDYRDRDRDRGERERDRPRDYDRRRRSRSRSRERPQPSRDRALSPPRNGHRSPANPSPVKKDGGASVTIFAKAAAPPSEPPKATTPPVVEDEKMRAKRERLEAWKKEREAKKALEEAKAKALALATAKTGTLGTGSATTKLPPSAAKLPAKPTGQLNRNNLTALGLKGLPIKPDVLKKAKTAAAAMDDSVETARKLVKLGDMPAVDMTQVEGEAAVGENLEAGDDDDDDAAAAMQDVVMQNNAMDEEEEEDPLDAFMTGVITEVKKVNAEDREKHGVDATMDIDGNDEAGDDVPEAVPDELDATNLRPEDILALAAKKIKKKDLAVTDHTRIKYEPFRSNFYSVPPEIADMEDGEVDVLRLALDGIKIRGLDCPRPITKWSHCGLPTSCLDVIARLGYTGPTPIQAQAIPAIMSGRDVIGVAKTGSGKTMAFILPLLRHIKDQRPLDAMEGPMALVMTPTRELAVQIHKEMKPFLKALNLRAVCAYGGSPIKDQIADMKKGAEIAVCTPGRMIDLLTANSGRVTNLKRVTYMVLDEADRMFDMGFEPQVMKIVNNVRPDRQTVLFSATFPKQMESLARKILKKPLEIIIGSRSVVAPEIEQIVEVRTEDSKFDRLLEILGKTYNEDKDARTLIFVDRQEAADNLLRELLRKGYPCMSLHGGKDQVDRDQTIADFKSGVVPIVTATSVAARGLDVKQLKLVINYDVPNHMEDYVHRAGRTGRAGNKGTCVTFITPEQERYSVDIQRALKSSKAPVPEDLDKMATEFLEKVNDGRVKSFSSSGFGGKGLDKLDKERDAKERAQRSAYGEGEEKPAAKEETKEEGGTAKADATDTAELPFEFKVEIKRGPAPDTSKIVGIASKSKEDEKVANSKLRAAEEAAAKAGKDTAAFKQAQSVVAKLNAQVRAAKLALHAQTAASSDDGKKPKDPDATDFHAIIPINDYPQKARWRVTNKETMVQLVDMTGASVTNKGIYYESGKEPGADQPPKLHLLIESNDEFRVEQAVREIKRLLIEASTAALQAESRNPTATVGRYSVV